ncbi:hypothetical protein F5148DRAFT_1274424 [Russula earlei]|uniref:Uncharacterized protein n=1 Tax=Russula earlei TaxID=71964 RepID=A0ACC0UHQ9_9AGAM|nr:hypothetical protein F5148DRAFT_1274424 [Russula earlei]
MIGNSWPEYLFIRIAIFALRLIAPLSLIHLAASYHAGAFLLSPFLGAYALLEAAFFLFVYLPRSYYLQRHPPRMSRAEREALFHKCAESMTAESISGWFIRSPGGQLWRDNVVDWLLWALFSSRTHDTLREWQDELDYYIAVMGEYVGYPLRPGANPEMQCLRLTMDPVPMVHRPFIWYMLVCVVDTLASVALYFQGFTHYNTRKWFNAFPPRPLLALFSNPSRDAETNIPYWYRSHRSPTKLPILFIHGIGIGLLPYIPFLHDLVAQDPDVGILAIEILPVSMHITSSPARTRIAAALLIDPIPFLLHHPSIAYNFVYRRPRRANEWQLWYFASREPDTARALSRHFFWFESILFREDRGRLPIAVSLAGRDQIVDAPAVHAYLTDGEEQGSTAEEGAAGAPSRWAQHGLEVLYFPELDHATVFDTPKDRAVLLEVLRRFVRQEGGETETEVDTAVASVDDLIDVE